MRKILSFIFILQVLLSKAQDVKMEKEERIRSREVPTFITDLLCPYRSDLSRLKFYKETDGNRSSVEAKFSYEKWTYSVEFSDDGQLEDVEVLIGFDSIPPDVQKTIHSYLAAYENYKIEKIQLQLIPNPDDLQNSFRQMLTQLASEILNYEVEVNIKEEGAWKSYEVLFDRSGYFIQRKEIVNRSAEYILY